VIVIEGVLLDRTDQGLTPRFLKGEPPSNTDVAHVVQAISRRVIRNLIVITIGEALWVVLVSATFCQWPLLT
jgi:hypothetical protein